MMRKRPSGQNNNYGHQKRRHSHGGGGHSNNGGGNRPRKNYSAMREKYMGQARDALAGGDRVLAEYFYQHADHCYRMMMEEGFRPNRPQQQAESEAAPEVEAVQEMSEMPEIQNTNPLPAFITSGYNTDTQKPAEEPVVQNWEERDA
ncbi:MAG: DUF4167 domain-containing protein [Alphaproteobacteria bacterium]